MGAYSCDSSSILFVIPIIANTLYIGLYRHDSPFGLKMYSASGLVIRCFEFSTLIKRCRAY